MKLHKTIQLTFDTRTTEGTPTHTGTISMAAKLSLLCSDSSEQTVPLRQIRILHLTSWC